MSLVTQQMTMIDFIEKEQLSGHDLEKCVIQVFQR